MIKKERERHQGLKMTPQRMAILNYLKGNLEHPSAEDIYKAIGKKFPTMSFATVYNTLETLKQMGQIRELYCDPYKKRFDPNPNPHHHVVCTQCQKIVDLQDEIRIKPPTLTTEKFEILGSHIEFYGICSKCKSKNSSSRKEETIYVKNRTGS